MMGGRWRSLSFLTSSVLLDTGHNLASEIGSYNPIEFWDRLLVILFLHITKDIGCFQSIDLSLSKQNRSFIIQIHH